MGNDTTPVRVPKQNVPARRGKAGYIGEEEGLVETFERELRFPQKSKDETLKSKLAGMTDDELAILGVLRADAPERSTELHEFKPNRGGVNCSTCRKSKANGDHTPPVPLDKDGEETPANERVVGERKEPAKPTKAAMRHRPKATAAKE